MKDRDLFTAAGIAAIAGGILAYSIVTNKEAPVSSVQLSGQEQIEQMAIEADVSCTPEMVALGNDKPKRAWICNGVFTKQINEYVEEQAKGLELYKVEKKQLPPPK